jgi:hypothetical protein
VLLNLWRACRRLLGLCAFEMSEGNASPAIWMEPSNASMMSGPLPTLSHSPLDKSCPWIFDPSSFLQL